jgi:hypothetical protein
MTVCDEPCAKGGVARKHNMSGACFAALLFFEHPDLAFQPGDQVECPCGLRHNSNPNNVDNLYTTIGKATVPTADECPTFWPTLLSLRDYYGDPDQANGRRVSRVLCASASRPLPDITRVQVTLINEIVAQLPLLHQAGMRAMLESLDWRIKRETTGPRVYIYIYTPIHMYSCTVCVCVCVCARACAYRRIGICCCRAGMHYQTVNRRLVDN